MEIAEMVLGNVSISLWCTMVEDLRGQCGRHQRQGRRTVKGRQRSLSDGQDIGYVGDVKDVNPKILYDLLEKDFLPIICPVGLDDEL